MAIPSAGGEACGNRESGATQNTHTHTHTACRVLSHTRTHTVTQHANRNTHDQSHTTRSIDPLAPLEPARLSL
jgi:hypothetical protein